MVPQPYPVGLEFGKLLFREDLPSLLLPPTLRKFSKALPWGTDFLSASTSLEKSPGIIFRAQRRLLGLWHVNWRGAQAGSNGGAVLYPDFCKCPFPISSPEAGGAVGFQSGMANSHCHVGSSQGGPGFLGPIEAFCTQASFCPTETCCNLSLLLTPTSPFSSSL